MRSDKSMGAVSASAADLKFLHRLRQTHFRNFKSKSGTRIICLLVPLLLPKFVSEGAAMYHELRKRGTRSVQRHCHANGICIQIRPFCSRGAVAFSIT